MDNWKVFLILDRLFIINSFIVISIFLLSALDFFNIIEVTNKVRIYIIILLLTYLVESFLYKIRHLNNIDFYENKHITDY